MYFEIEDEGTCETCELYYVCPCDPETDNKICLKELERKEEIKNDIKLI